MNNSLKSDPDSLSLLQSAELFSTLLRDDLSYIATRTDVFQYSAGQVIFESGDPARSFFIVRSGSVVIKRLGEDGREVELARFVQGDAFGDFDFVMQANFNAQAVALEETTLLLFPGKNASLETMAQEVPGAVSRLLLRSLSMMSARLRSTNRLISENTPWLHELRRQVYSDPATGLWSQDFINEEVPRFLEGPTILIMLKPDRFKDLNDARGHSAGDEAMQRISSILSSEVAKLRKGWPIRLRSNETAVVLPQSSEEEAQLLIRRLIRGIQSIHFPATQTAPAFSFTASVAYSLWPHDDHNWKKLLKRNYEALMKAWTDGGNCVYRLKPRPEGVSRD